MNSTLRFFARPSSVSSGATGNAAPIPARGEALDRHALRHEVGATASTRFLDRVRFAAALPAPSVYPRMSTVTAGWPAASPRARRGTARPAPAVRPSRRGTGRRRGSRAARRRPAVRRRRRCSRRPRGPCRLPRRTVTPVRRRWPDRGPRPEHERAALVRGPPHRLHRRLHPGGGARRRTGVGRDGGDGGRRRDGRQCDDDGDARGGDGRRNHRGHRRGLRGDAVAAVATGGQSHAHERGAEAGDREGGEREPTRTGRWRRGDGLLREPISCGDQPLEAVTMFVRVAHPP